MYMYMYANSVQHVEWIYTCRPGHLTQVSPGCVILTLVTDPMKLSTGSSPLESSTVNCGPQSQNRLENTPYTLHEMNCEEGEREGREGRVTVDGTNQDSHIHVYTLMGGL